MYKIIHNPRCTKSRQTLALLEEESDHVEIIKYLEGELTSDLLGFTFENYKGNHEELIRNKEDEFQKVKIDFNNSESFTKAVLKYPKILERPIVIKGKKVVIGRPPENVKVLF
tara:strand:+ start:1593 stop:1931 length:339 start_codon:yes stop_codon:yes gene_type:complete